MEKKVSVITPFFQRQHGLLRKAIASVANQQGLTARVEVIVVDDGSPVPADGELKGIWLPENVVVRVIKQRNAGCYPACNTALSNVAEDTDYIAFLDSDDEWFEAHLRRAVWALANGCDFYFSDFYQLAQSVSAFRRDARIDLDEHRRIHPCEPIHEFSANMFNQIVRKNLLGTSTIVYDRKRFGDLRYLDGYRHTGAEYILWLNMATRIKRAAFSSEPECRYGSGVNIFAEAAWGTDKYLSVRQDEIKYRKYVLSHFTLGDGQRAHVEDKIRESRVNFCLGLVHNLLHNGRIGRGILERQLKSDPMTVATLLATPWIVGLRRVRRSTKN